MSHIIALLILTLSAIVQISAGESPSQIHLALGGIGEFSVTWFTHDETLKNPFCRYGEKGTDDLYMSSKGASLVYLEGYGAHHSVMLTGLRDDMQYNYQCGDESNNELSTVRSFKTPTLPSSNNTDPLSFLIFGDMGYLDSVQRPMGVLGSVTMEHNWSAVFSRELMEDLNNRNAIDMVFHVGDVGYADDAVFHSMETAVQFLYEDAYNGYMDWIENVTSSLAYHVTPGNHESECHDPLCVVQFKELGIPLSNFTAYNKRWRMPSASSGGVESMWYSWNYGAVHFISIDTSTDFEGAPEGEKGDSGIFDAGHFADDGVYMQWVEDDLKKASEDPSISWIIAGGHRPFGSFNSTEIDVLFAKYGVDMYFAGHAHSYSRYAASDHNGCVHITVGGAGCEEMKYAEDNPTPGWHNRQRPTTCEEWVKNGGHVGSKSIWQGGKLHSPDPMQMKNDIRLCEDAEFFSDAYALGQLTVENNGKGDLHWKLLSSMDGSVIDEITLSQ